jgi:ATP-dependent DNA helicase RecG
MTDAELDALLADQESDRVERKESAKDLEPIRKAICALANDLPGHGLPGVVFVGVRDDGIPAGIAVNDDLLTRLSGIPSEGLIVPIPSIDVRRHRVGNADVAAILVHPAPAPPVRYRGCVHIRRGPTTQQASAHDEQRLTERRRARDLPFDIRSLESSDLNDLNLSLFSQEYLPAAIAPEILEQNDRPLNLQLAALRFATPPPRVIPTVLGMLVTGKDPAGFVPGAYVQFLRIGGGEIRDEKRVTGPLAQLVRRTEEVMEVRTEVQVDFTSEPRERRSVDYPIVALQQLIRNAVMHRDYEGSNSPIRISWHDDQIEILSPGGPFGIVNARNFGQPGLTDYRNPHLAEAMRNLGFVQRFGQGIQAARQALEKNGNPPLEFEVRETHVLARLRRRT